MDANTVDTSVWCRRLRDGRTLVIAVTNGYQLPEGINDAVVNSTLSMGELRDETAAGVGKTWAEIVEDGWKGLPKPRLARAIELLG